MSAHFMCFGKTEAVALKIINTALYFWLCLSLIYLISFNFFTFKTDAMKLYVSMYFF